MAKPIVSPVIPTANPKGRLLKNGNVLYEGDEATKLNKQSGEIYMKAYAAMQLPDRLFALLARMTPGPKYEKFSRLIETVMWRLAGFRAPAACLRCGSPMPLPGIDFCVACNKDPYTHEWFAEESKEWGGGDAYRILREKQRKDPQYFAGDMAIAIRGTIWKLDKHYVRSIYDVIALTCFDTGIDRLAMGLAVANWGNLVPDDNENSKQFNNGTMTILKWCPYDIYLKTDHWQQVRDEALERAGHRCQMCNKADSLQVHHRTYENRGKEQPGDMTVLCRDCHRTFHENGKVQS